MYNEEGECGTGAVVPWAVAYGSSPTDRTNRKDPRQALRDLTLSKATHSTREHRRHAGQPHDPQGVNN